MDFTIIEHYVVVSVAKYVGKCRSFIIMYSLEMPLVTGLLITTTTCTCNTICAMWFEIGE